jgi:hypothetical protein
MDIIVVFPTEYLEVWLVNKGDIIFLSWLDLRPLKPTLYQEVNSNQLRVLHSIVIVLI